MYLLTFFVPLYKKFKENFEDNIRKVLGKFLEKVGEFILKFCDKYVKMLKISNKFLKNPLKIDAAQLLKFTIK